MRSACIITQNASFGGMEVHTLGLMKALVDEGYEIELIENRYHGYDQILEKAEWGSRVRIIHTDLSGILYGERSDTQGWRQVLARMTSDLVVLPKGNNNYGQIGFLRECRRVFKKVIFIEHLEARERPTTSRRRFGVIPGLGLWWHKRRILSRLGSRYADKIVAVSVKVRERLVTDMRYPPDKTLVIRNGVPWEVFTRRPEWGSAVRTSYGIPADAFVFGMMSRLSAEKGIDTALRAVRALKDRHADRSFVLVVAGDGYEGDRLKALARDLAIDDRVLFIGFVTEPEKILSAYDVILFSSRLEGLPLGLLQGMAAGCVPIVTRISGMPEVVDSPEVGWVVAPDHPEELSEALAAVLLLKADPLARMRRNAVERVRQHFDVAKANRAFLELCRL